MFKKYFMLYFVFALASSNLSKAENKIVNDLVIAVSMPSFPYPFSEEESEHRDKMQNIKNYFHQVTRGSIKFNFDLDQDGEDDLFHIMLPEDIDPCDRTDKVAALARNLAVQQKPNIEFNHTTLLIKRISCSDGNGWAARAHGGNLVISKGSVNILPHEYGHNIGFPHTLKDSNNDEKGGEGYGNQDPMEGGGMVFYNAPHIWGKEWFGDCSDCFQTWETNQNNVTIAPLGTPSLSNKPILIARIADEANPKKYYFVSYRAPLPGTYEENLKPSSQSGISIHHASGKLKMTYLIHVMQDKEVYTIPNTPIKFTQHSHDMSGAKISVNLGYPCSKSKNRKPDQFPWGKGTLALPYAICTSEQFAYLTNNPSLWKKSFNLAVDLRLNNLEFNSIGTEEIPFTGRFFGRNHTIEAKSNQALFGVTRNAVIKDFRLQKTLLDQSKTTPFGFVAEKAFDTTFENIAIEDFSMLLSNNQAALVGTLENGFIRQVIVNGQMKYMQDIDVVGGLVGSSTNIQIEKSTAQLITRAQLSSDATISRFGSLVGFAKKSKITESYALNDFFLWPSYKNIFAVGSLIGQAANVELNQVYFSGEINAHASQNPATLISEIIDDPSDTPDTFASAKNALLATNGGRKTLVGEKVLLEEIKSKNFLLNRGFSPDTWLLEDGVLPKLFYEFDPDDLPSVIED